MNSSIKSPEPNFISLSWTIMSMATVKEYPESLQHNKRRDWSILMTDFIRIISKRQIGFMVMLLNNSTDLSSLHKLQNSTWPLAHYRHHLPIKSTTHVLIVHKVQSFHLGKEFVHANQDINLIHKQTNVSVSLLSNHAIKLEHVSACVPKISQDGIQLINCVRLVLLISLLLTEQPAHVSLARWQLQTGTSSLINVSHVLKIHISNQMYQSVFHAKMTKSMIRQQESVYPFVSRIKFIANNKGNVTLFKS